MVQRQARSEGQGVDRPVAAPDGPFRRALAAVPFATSDGFRRAAGRVLDAWGWGPVQAPSRIAYAEAGVSLRAYGAARTGPVLLIVPAPIKRAYIWDLEPRVSVVRHCLGHGLRVYLADWERPGDALGEFGLDAFADRLILGCLDAIAAETGRGRVFLAGHSLGGTLAAIFAALHPDRVAGLTIVEAPLHFAPDLGPLDRVAAGASARAVLDRVGGNVAGSLLDLIAGAADPLTFGGARLADWAASLGNPQAVRTHLRVVRWTLDESPMPRRLFGEIVDLLYREDRFMLGDLSVGGRRAAPAAVRCPLLSILDARSRIIPPGAVLPFHFAARAADHRLLWYPGDTGVCLQHVGTLVGRTAHRHLWPQVVTWIDRHSEATTRCDCL